MQTYDILMMLVLVAATFFGFWKGMAWQIASLASLVVSYFVALRFSGQLAPTFGDSDPWNRFVAMFAIYIATSFVIWTLFRVISGAIDRVKLESFDHQMGAIIGLAKGVLLCVAITFFAVTLLPQAQKDSIMTSQAGHYIVVLLDKTDSVVPEEIHQVIGPYIHRIEERIDPNYQPQPGHAPLGQDPLGQGLMGQDVRSLWQQESSTTQQPGTTQPVTSRPQQQPFPSQSFPPQTAERPTGLNTGY